MVRKGYTAVRAFYKRAPRAYSLYEILFVLGMFSFIVWVLPFWFWAIYRYHLNVPLPVEGFFFALWSHMTVIRVICLPVTVALLVITSLVRRDTLKDLGIRTDNLRKSARECTFLLCAIQLTAVIVFLLYDASFVRARPLSYIMGFLSYPIWGVLQQFFLQSIVYLRLYQISGRKVVAVSAAGIIFAIIHTPNIGLMTVTLIFGIFAGIIFSRNRNIFTLGITQGIAAVVVSALLIPGVIANLYIGPRDGDPRFIDELLQRVTAHREIGRRNHRPCQNRQQEHLRLGFIRPALSGLYQLPSP